jgi:proteasome lid subunit RPN8/RPN11
MSAIELHDRESLGFLIGHPDRHFIAGKMTECITVHAAYAMQSADRGRSMVGFGNLAARRRVENTVKTVGFAIVGGYHSHPNGSAKISTGDVEAISEDLEEVYSNEGMESWLEIVVGVRKIKNPKASSHLRKYYVGKKSPPPGFYPWNIKPEIAGDVLVSPKVAYRINMAGYRFAKGKVLSSLLCYSRY